MYRSFRKRIKVYKFVTKGIISHGPGPQNRAVRRKECNGPQGRNERRKESKKRHLREEPKCRSECRNFPPPVNLERTASTPFHLRRNLAGLDREARYRTRPARCLLELLLVRECTLSSLWAWMIQVSALLVSRVP